jgi:hypothetical protein
MSETISRSSFSSNKIIYKDQIYILISMIYGLTYELISIWTLKQTRHCTSCIYLGVCDNQAV